MRSKPYWQILMVRCARTINDMERSYVRKLNPQVAERLAQQIRCLLIEKQYLTDPGISERDLCGWLGVNRPTVAATMQLHFDGTFREVLNRWRIDRAKVLLKDKRQAALSCEQIGLSVGFASRQSFYNSWRKIVGGTPQEYRRNYM